MTYYAMLARYCIWTGVSLSTYRDEEVRYASLVFQPGLTILGAAPVDVTRGAVGNHAAEEYRIEPRKGAPVFLLLAGLFGKEISIRDAYLKPVISPHETANQASEV